MVVLTCPGQSCSLPCAEERASGASLLTFQGRLRFAQCRQSRFARECRVGVKNFVERHAICQILEQNSHRQAGAYEDGSPPPNTSGSDETIFEAMMFLASLFRFHFVGTPICSQSDAWGNCRVRAISPTAKPIGLCRSLANADQITDHWACRLTTGEQWQRPLSDDSDPGWSPSPA